jgi:hypothetical protein
MNTIGVILLAAATATSGIGKPHVAKRLFRHHAVADGPAPPGGPINAAAMAAMAPGGGAGGAGFAGNRRFPNVRSQVFFVDPAGMKIGWQASGGGGERVYLPAQLTVPARYNFQQGYIYRLKITDIPGRPGLNLYPTIEVAPSTPATDAYLTHNPIPCQFTEEDFDQVTAGNFVTKVIYLPDPKYQELAIAGVETLVSTRLEPGVDPILEADRRGTILMVIRLGAIDLEMPNSGASVVGGGTAPGAPMTLQPGTAPGTFLPPGTTPPPSGYEMQPLGTPQPTPPPAPAAPPETGTAPPPAPPPANEPAPGLPPTDQPAAPSDDLPALDAPAPTQNP